MGVTPATRSSELVTLISGKGSEPAFSENQINDLNPSAATSATGGPPTGSTSAVMASIRVTLVRATAGGLASTAIHGTQPICQSSTGRVPMNAAVETMKGIKIMTMPFLRRRVAKKRISRTRRIPRAMPATAEKERCVPACLHSSGSIQRMMSPLNIRPRVSQPPWPKRRHTSISVSIRNERSTEGVHPTMTAYTNAHERTRMDRAICWQTTEVLRRRTTLPATSHVKNTMDPKCRPDSAKRCIKPASRNPCTVSESINERSPSIIALARERTDASGKSRSMRSIDRLCKRSRRDILRCACRMRMRRTSIAVEKPCPSIQVAASKLPGLRA